LNAAAPAGGIAAYYRAFLYDQISVSVNTDTAAIIFYSRVIANRRTRSQGYDIVHHVKPASARCRFVVLNDSAFSQAERSAISIDAAAVTRRFAAFYDPVFKNKTCIFADIKPSTADSFVAAQDGSVFHGESPAEYVYTAAAARIIGCG